MTTTLVIDPGARGCGLAYFKGPTLTYANFIANPETEGSGPRSWFALADAVYADMKERSYRVDVYVCELMQIYFRPGKGANPNDLLELAAVSAAIGASFPVKEAYGYYPRSWTGTSPKSVRQPRILAQLSDVERESILEKRKTFLDHAVDAIGIGLYHLERKSIRLVKTVNGVPR